MESQLRKTAPPSPVPPASLEEAEARRRELVENIQRIQSQLSSRHRTTPGGDRVATIKYKEWRQRVIYAMTCLLRDLRSVKAWIRDRRVREGLAAWGLPKNPSTDDLLLALHVVARRLAAGTKPTADEQGVLEAVRHWAQFRRLVK